MNQLPLTTTGLEMPVDFPREPYEAVFSLVAPFAEHQQIAWEEFGGAWNAVSYRFMAACQYGDFLQAWPDGFNSYGAVPRGEVPVRVRTFL